MIKEWIAYILSKGITPNQYYLLSCIQEKLIPSNINTSIELRILKNGGWLDERNQLTKISEVFLDDVEATFLSKAKRKRKFVLGDEHLEKIEEYKALFPKGKLPSGQYARQNSKELLNNFTWFFETYPDYGWDVILEATKDYVESFAGGNLYMQTSKYFIKKQDKNGTITSGLATACDGIIEADEEEENTSHINIL